MSESKLVTIGVLAVRVGVPENQLRRFADRNPALVPHARLGKVRVFDLADLDRIRQACRAAGLLDDAAAAGAT